jgi:hypothetical protein
MKYEILGLLTSNKNYDGIDIAHILGKPIDQVYACLQELENEGKIKKVYVGLSSCYKLV